MFLTDYNETCSAAELLKAAKAQQIPDRSGFAENVLHISPLAPRRLTCPRRVRGLGGAPGAPATSPSIVADRAPHAVEAELKQGKS